MESKSTTGGKSGAAAALKAVAVADGAAAANAAADANANAATGDTAKLKITSWGSDITSRRLARELCQLQEEGVGPYIHISVPRGQRLRIWRVTVKSSSPSAEDVLPPLRLTIYFGDDYPSRPPAIYASLENYLPHPCIARQREVRGRAVCLDMLSFMPHGSDTPYSGWTAAMCMSGLVVQLQSTLMDKTLLYDFGNDTLSRAVDSMRQYHTASGPVQFGHVDWEGSGVSLVATNDFFRKLPSIVPVTVFRDGENSSRKNAASKTPMSTQNTNTSVPLVATAGSVNADAGKVWQQVVRKGRNKDIVRTSLATRTSTSAFPKQRENRFKLLRSMTSTGKRNGGVAKVTKASLKNARRRERRHAAALKREQDRSAAAQAALVSNGAESQDAESKCAESKCANSKQTCASTGNSQISSLPIVIWWVVSMFVSPDDMESLARTCRGMRRKVGQSSLWAAMLMRLAKNRGDKATLELRFDTGVSWRRIFHLQYHQLHRNLVCFHTRKSMHDGVLGLPVDYTVNPKKRVVDYVETTPDYLSQEAYDSGLRRTAWNRRFKAWLPVYLTHEHFDRALPSIKATIAKITSPKGLRRFMPYMVLDVLPKIMNTAVVLIAQRGVAVSEHIIDMFCQVHRLFVALVERFPTLRKRVHWKISQFLHSEDMRSKGEVPSLGDFIALLSVSDTHGWNTVVRKLFQEQLDRGVLWMCREDPSLEKIGSLPPGEHREVLDKIWKARTVSSRHMMINRALLQLVRPDGQPMVKTIADRDYLFGHADGSRKARFMEQLRIMDGVSGWSKFFDLTGIKNARGAKPGPRELMDWMKLAVRNSERRGYHRKGMDFSRVHASGGSRLMRRGDSISLGKLAEVQVFDCWQFTSHSLYLDATLLAFDFDGRYVAKADYMHSEIRGTTHSGDIMTDRTGTHRIRVRLRSLERCVQSLYLVLSAYDTATLDDIMLPNVYCQDGEGSELCRYELEAQGQKVRGMKNVIMCRIWRPQKSAPWKVDAIGLIGAQGNANDYSPIIETIRRSLQQGHIGAELTRGQEAVAGGVDGANAASAASCA